MAAVDDGSLAPSYHSGREDSEQQGDHHADADDDDRRIEAALDCLDEYQSRREEMDRHLKSAFFDLARAKQALGPSRVGPPSFRLGRLEPLITVDVLEGSTEDCYSEMRIQHAHPPVRNSNDAKGKGREERREFISRNGVVDLRLASGEAHVDEKAKEKGSGNSLKKRLKSKFVGRSSTSESSALPSALANDDSSARYTQTTTPTETIDQRHSPDGVSLTDGEKLDKRGEVEEGPFAEDAVPPPPPPPAYGEVVHEHMRDPIDQFSAFPPVALRSAQREFRLALEHAVRVVNAKQRFEHRLAAAASSRKPGFRTLGGKEEGPTEGRD